MRLLAFYVCMSGIQIGINQSNSESAEGGGAWMGCTESYGAWRAAGKRWQVPSARVILSCHATPAPRAI